MQLVKSHKITKKLKKYYELDNASKGRPTKDERRLWKKLHVIEGKFSPMQTLDEIKKKIKKDKNVVFASRWTDEYYGDIVVLNCSEKEAIVLINKAIASLTQKKV